MHLKITEEERRTLLASLAVRISRLYSEIAEEEAEPDCSDEIICTLVAAVQSSDNLYRRLRTLPNEEAQP